MSEYKKEEFITDFIERTDSNFRFINERSDEAGAYEVTQLINSLLGIIVMPTEHYKGRELKPTKNKEDFTEVKNSIEMLLEKCREDGRYRNTYSKQTFGSNIKHIRNSIAHSGDKGIFFYPIHEEGENIKGVVFYDRDIEINQNTKEELRCRGEFCLYLLVDELVELKDQLVKMYKLSNINVREQEKYDIAVEELRYFLLNGNREKSVASIINDRYKQL